MVKIDDMEFDIPVLSIKRKADFIDKYLNRSEDGGVNRELMGVFFNYQLEFGRGYNTAEYARLWDKLTEPQEFHKVTVPDENGEFTFEAYFSNVGDNMFRQAGSKNYFSNLTVNFTAKAPARK